MNLSVVLLATLGLCQQAAGNYAFSISMSPREMLDYRRDKGDREVSFTAIRIRSYVDKDGEWASTPLYALRCARDPLWDSKQRGCGECPRNAAQISSEDMARNNVTAGNVQVYGCYPDGSGACACEARVRPTAQGHGMQHKTLRGIRIRIGKCNLDTELARGDVTGRGCFHYSPIAMESVMHGDASSLVVPDVECFNTDTNEELKFVASTDIPPINLAPSTETDPLLYMMRFHSHFGFESPKKIIREMGAALKENIATFFFVSQTSTQGNKVRIGPSMQELQQHCKIRFYLFNEIGGAVEGNEWINAADIPVNPEICSADGVTAMKAVYQEALDRFHSLKNISVACSMPLNASNTSGTGNMSDAAQPGTTSPRRFRRLEAGAFERKRHQNPFRRLQMDFHRSGLDSHKYMPRNPARRVQATATVMEMCTITGSMGGQSVTLEFGEVDKRCCDSLKIIACQDFSSCDETHSEEVFRQKHDDFCKDCQSPILNGLKNHAAATNGNRQMYEAWKVPGEQIGWCQENGGQNGGHQDGGEHMSQKDRSCVDAIHQAVSSQEGKDCYTKLTSREDGKMNTTCTENGTLPYDQLNTTCSTWMCSEYLGNVIFGSACNESPNVICCGAGDAATMITFCPGVEAAYNTLCPNGCQRHEDPCHSCHESCDGCFHLADKLSCHATCDDDFCKHGDHQEWELKPGMDCWTQHRVLEEILETAIARSFLFTSLDVYSGCKGMLNSWIIGTPMSVTKTVSGCTEPEMNEHGEFNMKWYNDPCCNREMQRKQCCAPRQVTYTKTRVETNNTALAIFGAVTNDTVIAPLVATMYSDMATNTASVCFKTYKKLLNDLTNSHMVVEQCSQDVFGDKFERKHGPACNVPSDCWTGECAIPPAEEGKKAGTQKYCKTPLDTESKDAFEPIMKCILSQMMEIGQHFKYELGLSQDATTSEVAAKMLVELPQLSHEECQGRHHDFWMITNKEQCEQGKECNWNWNKEGVQCTDPCGGDASNPKCPNYCGSKTDKREVSKFPLCEVLVPGGIWTYHEPCWQEIHEEQRASEVACHTCHNECHQQEHHDETCWQNCDLNSCHHDWTYWDTKFEACIDTKCKALGSDNYAVFTNMHDQICIDKTRSFDDTHETSCTDECYASGGPNPTSPARCYATLNTASAVEGVCHGFGEAWMEERHDEMSMHGWDWSMGHPAPKWCLLRGYLELNGKPYKRPPPFGDTCLKECEDEIHHCMHPEKCWEWFPSPIEASRDMICWVEFETKRADFDDCMNASHDCGSAEACRNREHDCAQQVGLLSADSTFVAYECTDCYGPWTNEHKRQYDCLSTLDNEQCRWNATLGTNVSQPCAFGCMDTCWRDFEACENADKTICAAQVNGLNQCRECPFIRCEPECTHACDDFTQFHWWGHPAEACTGCNASDSTYLCAPGKACFSNETCFDGANLRRLGRDSSENQQIVGLLERNIEKMTRRSRMLYDAHLLFSTERKLRALKDSTGTVARRLQRSISSIKERRLVEEHPQWVQLDECSGDCSAEQQLCQAFWQRDASDASVVSAEQQRINDALDPTTPWAWAGAPWENNDLLCEQYNEICFVSIDAAKTDTLATRSWDCTHMQDDSCLANNCNNCTEAASTRDTCDYCCTCHSDNAIAQAAGILHHGRRHVCELLRKKYEDMQGTNGEDNWAMYAQSVVGHMHYDDRLLGGAGACTHHINVHALQMAMGGRCEMESWLPECQVTVGQQHCANVSQFTFYRPTTRWQKGSHNTVETCEAKVCDPEPWITTQAACENVNYCQGDCPYCETDNFWDWENSRRKAICIFKKDNGDDLTAAECTVVGAAATAGESGTEFFQNPHSKKTVCKTEPPSSAQGETVSDKCRGSRSANGTTYFYTAVKCGEFARSDCQWARDTFTNMECGVQRLQCRNRDDCMESGRCEYHTDDWLVEQDGGLCLQRFSFSDSNQGMDMWSECERKRDGNIVGRWAHVGCALFSTDSGTSAARRRVQADEHWEGTDDGGHWDGAADGEHWDDPNGEHWDDQNGEPWDDTTSETWDDQNGENWDETGSTGHGTVGGDPSNGDWDASDDWDAHGGWTEQEMAFPAPGMTKERCVAAGAKWFPYARTKSECTVPGYVWGTDEADGFAPGTMACCVEWGGKVGDEHCWMYSEETSNQTQCALCGGKWMSVFRFQYHGNWVVGKWKNAYSWQERKVENRNVWTTALSRDGLWQKLESLAYQIRNGPARNFAECRAGSLSDLMVSIGTREPPTPTMGTSEVKPQMETSDTLGDTTISTTNTTTNETTQIALQRSPAVSERRGNDDSARRSLRTRNPRRHLAASTQTEDLPPSCWSVVENDDGKTVGQLVGDCIVFKPHPPLSGPLDLCLPINMDIQVNVDFSQIDLATKQNNKVKAANETITQPSPKHGCAQVQQSGTYCLIKRLPEYQGSAVQSRDNTCTAMQELAAQVAQELTDIKSSPDYYNMLASTGFVVQNGTITGVNETVFRAKVVDAGAPQATSTPSPAVIADNGTYTDTSTNPPPEDVSCVPFSLFALWILVF